MCIQKNHYDATQPSCDIIFNYIINAHNIVQRRQSSDEILIALIRISSDSLLMFVTLKYFIRNLI